MNLTQQKTDSFEQNIKRIFGATEVVIRAGTAKDIKGFMIRTERGALDVGLGPYSDLAVQATEPETDFVVSFSAFGADISKSFKTADERDAFFDSLPEEQRNTAKKFETTK